MVDDSDDDLFQSTKMTFGQHLDELRSALFKAVLSLVGGILIGLWMGDQVLHLIQDPLVDALKVYYQEQAIAHSQIQIAQWKKEGLTVPDWAKDPAKLEQLVVAEGMLPEERYVLVPDVAAALENRYPKAVDKTTLPTIDPGSTISKKDMIPIWLWHPIDEDDRIQAKGWAVQEGFVVWMKAALVAGAIISSPLVFFFIWSFVAAGLYPHEKRYVYIFLPFSLGLFLLGAATVFLLVFPPVLNFLLDFYRWLGMDLEPRITDWLRFVLLLPLGFGIAFQLPLVMLFLERIGIFDVKAYVDNWRVSVLVISVISMVLTPADPYSMMLMFVPLTILYFGGILLCRWMPRRAA